jgi:DNA-binding CsgD family transcriptional regulator
METSRAGAADRRRFAHARTERNPALLVGRREEQAALREDLDAAVRGEGRVALISGEAGIGKTTLVRHLAREAASRGAQVLVGGCYDLSNAPAYGPWLELFAGAGRAPALPEPPAAFSGGEMPRVTDQAALFASVRGYLAALTQVSPVLLIFEDLQWSDSSSIDLLRDVSRRASELAVLIVVTYRTEDLTRSHPLYLQLPALVRETDGRRIDLRPLDHASLRELVMSRAELAAPDVDRLVAYLDQHAEGNPFFATELLRTLEEKGLLVMRDGSWALEQLERVVLPPLLVQVIESRVSRLGDAVRKALAIAAIIGQDAPLALWSEIAGLGEAELFDTIERAIDAHLLESDNSGTQVRFVHAVTRDALYESVLPPRRRMWHTQVAEALILQDRPDPDAVAHHLQLAGDPRAWRWLVKAGERALNAYAWATAVERFEEAVNQVLIAEPRESATACELLCRVAFLQRFSAPAEAVDAIERARLIPGWQDDPVLKAEVLWMHGALFLYSNRIGTGIAIVRECFEALEEARPEWRWLPGYSIQHYIGGKQFSGALERFRDSTGIAAEPGGRSLREVVEAYRDGAMWFKVVSGAGSGGLEHFAHLLTDAPGVSNAPAGFALSGAWVYLGLGVFHASGGRPLESRAAYAESKRRYREIKHHALEAIVLLIESADVAATYGLREPAYRRTLAADGEAAMRRAGGALRSGLTPQIARLRCMVLDGRWQEAAELLEASPTPGNAFYWRGMRWAAVELARCRGDARTAWEQIRQVFPGGPDTAPGEVIHQEGLQLQRLAAELCLDAGNIADGRRWLTAHDAWLQWSEAVLGIAAGELSWAHLLFADGDEGARSRAVHALALATDLDQPGVRLGAHRLLGELELQANHDNGAIAELSKSLELAEACELPFERALTLLPLAEAHLAAGRGTDAASLLADARSTLSSLGADPALARADAIAVRLGRNAAPSGQAAGLTGREIEVLGLIVAGRSNQEIADELFISWATARTHVANIFRKLDVGTRAEAVDAAHRRGIIGP